MQWVIAVVAFAILLVALPPILVRAKASSRRKGRVAGATLAIGLAFAAVFDPAKSAAIENIQKRSETGDTECEGPDSGPDEPTHNGSWAHQGPKEWPVERRPVH